jgi:chemotaxis protein methyltransferase WspC
MCQGDFEGLLKNAIGLDPASVGSGAIERAVRLRMTSLGLRQKHLYWERLQTSEAELQELIESVVVPETWFFRDREAYTLLARLILEEWLPAHAASTLRVLSVPCCTGEEPYSLVMALLDAGLPGERLQVDAVDISAQSIAKARRGAYGSNSFRGEDFGYRDRYFERSRSGYSFPRSLRNLVAFHHENLLSTGFRTGASAYDVIFCRNLLIYFDQTRQQMAMETLSGLLDAKGYLFVGAAEAFLAASRGFAAVDQAMSFAFRKERAGDSKRVDLRRTQLKRASVVCLKPAAPVAQAIAAAKLVPPQAASEEISLDDIKCMADSGRIAEASSLCEKHLKKERQSSEAYYLLGLMRDATGDPSGAGDCYRKALYLEPDHSEALAHLALLSERQGDAASAKRFRARAKRASASLKT